MGRQGLSRSSTSTATTARATRPAALAAGLKKATGEFIAIFDADFVPPRDILTNVVNYFTDDKVGMVQVRWDHLNRDASLLTQRAGDLPRRPFRHRAHRPQSLRPVHALQRHRRRLAPHHHRRRRRLAARHPHRRPRPQLSLPDEGLAVRLSPAVLRPRRAAAGDDRASSSRPTAGPRARCRPRIKLLPGILRSKHLRYASRCEAFFHLTNTLVYPLMVLLTLLMYPDVLLRRSARSSTHTWGQYVFSASLFVLATCSASTFFVFGQRELFGKEGRLEDVPLSAACSWRWASASASTTPRPSSKPSGARSGASPASSSARPSMAQQHGNAGQSARLAPTHRTDLHLPRLVLPIIEIAFGCYMACCMWISLWYQCGILPGSDKSGWASVPFLLIFAGGYLYVGFGSLWAMYQMSQEEEEEIIDIPELSA